MKINMPVLVLTARDSIEDKIKGLGQGANDYISKPFDVNELIARLRVIERRLGTANSSTITIGEACLDSASHQLTVVGQKIELSRKTFMLLKYTFTVYVKNSPRLLSEQSVV